MNSIMNGQMENHYFRFWFLCMGKWLFRDIGHNQIMLEYSDYVGNDLNFNSFIIHKCLVRQAQCLQNFISWFTEIVFHAIKTRVYFRLPTHPSFLTGVASLIWCYCNNKLLMKQRKNKLLNGQTHINNNCSKIKPQK